MNGRVYDYNLGRFLSVDPLIHMEGGSQGINPYSYLMNNPLAGIDPTGYEPEEPKTKTVMVSKTGSRIKSKVTVSAQTNSDGSATITFSGSNGAAVSSVKNSVASSLSGDGYNVSDIGSQSSVAQNTGGASETQNTDPRAEAGASFSQMASLAWEQLTEGDVVSDAVTKTDEQYFNGAPIAASSGAGEIIEGSVAIANSVVQSDPALAATGVMKLAESKIKLFRAPHGNSKDSPAPQHLYSIVDTTDGSIYKYGISNGKVYKNSTSKRLNEQLRNLNKNAGFRRYEGDVIMRNIDGRAQALALEKAFVYGYAAVNGGNKPIGNKRP